MSKLTKEFYNIQNPALGAYLLARFSLGYLEENQSMPPMPLLFVVLPMIYKKDVVDFISSTQKTSGLHFFVDKMMTLEALRISIIGELISIQDKVYILPLRDNINDFKPKTKDIRKMGNAAEKFGIWCSKLSLVEISQILKVRF